MDRDFVLDWPRGWNPRSFPYREGFHAGITLIPTECPFAVRSVEFVVWQAGFEHGKEKECMENES